MHVGVNQFAEFGGWKWFRERADCAEFLSFSENLFATMCGDENDWYFRLVFANAGDYLEAGDVRQEEIDDTKTKVSPAHLVGSIKTPRTKNHLVAVRLKHEPERVAYGGLVIYDEDA